MNESANRLVGGTGTVATVNVLSSYVISAVGFGKAGVVAGSTAAGIQSSIGGAVAAGSYFATFQSLGALGLGICGTVALPVAIGTGVAIATVPIIKKYWSSKKE